jgi:hypothetical protein
MSNPLLGKRFISATSSHIDEEHFQSFSYLEKLKDSSSLHLA